MAAGMAARARKPGPKPGTKKKCKPEGMEEEEWKVEQRRRKSLQQQARRALTALQAQQLTAAATEDAETQLARDSFCPVHAPSEPGASVHARSVCASLSRAEKSADTSTSMPSRKWQIAADLPENGRSAAFLPLRTS